MQQRTPPSASKRIHSALRSKSLDSRRECAAGAVTRQLCEFIDTDGASSGVVYDAGERRRSVRPGTRVSIALPAQAPPSAEVVALCAKTASVLENAPRAFVLAATALLLVNQLDEAEQVALEGLERFGVASEGVLLTLPLALIARWRSNWPEARRLYEMVRRCRIAEYRRCGFAAGALSAVEFGDQVSASRFLAELLQMGEAEAHTCLVRVVEARSARGDGYAARAALSHLKQQLRPNRRVMHV